MTTEEIEQFKEEIKKSIMPYAANMTEEQIKALLDRVQEENKDSLPEGFSNMLYEQIIMLKYNG